MNRIQAQNLSPRTQELFGNTLDHIVGGDGDVGPSAPKGDPTYLVPTGFNVKDTGTGKDKTEYGIFFTNTDTDYGKNGYDTVTATRDE